jgi:hypothetical protein
MPRVDADPVSARCARRGGTEDFGFLAIELDGVVRTEQEYLHSTPILITRLYNANGGAVEITDFAPRFRQFGRLFCPGQLIRSVKPLGGSPLVRVRLRPASGYGKRRPEATFGSNHLRFVAADYVFRVTTDCSITAIVEETPFILREGFSLVMGTDETLQGSVAEVTRRFLELTVDYWNDWVRDLSIPFEWQDEIIRAAITLKLATYDDTGAVVAALTTSIPESATSGRNWDYRHCWLRDAYFVVDALNRLNATRTMERHLGYIINVAARASRALQPVYRVSGKPELDEYEVDSLPGYRGMGPVRVGNQATAGATTATARRCRRRTRHRRLSAIGSASLFQKEPPRARGQRTPPDRHGNCAIRRVHTFPASCAGPRATLAKIAAHLGPRRAPATGAHADRIHAVICAWNASAAASSPRSRAGRWTRRCCCLPNSASCAPTTRASPPPSPAWSASCAAATSSSATPRPTISARRRTHSSSARSGTSTRWPRSDAATRRVPCSKPCSPGARGWAYALRAHRSCHGELWATSRRPTAWSA